MRTTVRALAFLAALASSLGWQSVIGAGQQFAARLDTVPIDFRTQAATTGNGAATATVAGNRIEIDGEFSGLASPATEAWVHIGPATGARGPAEHELTVTQSEQGTIHGAFRLDREALDALAAGRLYIQIHSQSAPDGNLWGWLLPRE